MKGCADPYWHKAKTPRSTTSLSPTHLPVPYIDGESPTGDTKGGASTEIRRNLLRIDGRGHEDYSNEISESRSGEEGLKLT
jgi:hypothetical protein